MTAHKIIPACMLAFLICIQCVTATGTEKIAIKATDEMLELDINGARLDEIVMALGDYFDFETLLIGDYSSSRSITTRLKAVPAASAVERIVANANSLIVYSTADVNDKTRRITQVWLLQASDDFTIAGSTETTEQGLSAADTKKRSYAVLRLARQVRSDNQDDESFEWILADLTQALLYDPDPLVRTRAATALGRADDTRAIAALQSALSDTHFSVRSQAINALGNIGDTEALNILGSLLTSEGIVDDSERAIAAQVLWKQDSEIARHYLREGATDRNQQIRELSSIRPKTPASRSGLNARVNSGKSEQPSQ